MPKQYESNSKSDEHNFRGHEATSLRTIALDTTWKNMVELIH